ncbi:hypothetical protein N9N97_00435 [Rickettsiaceae bacterium]|nr:hypothetical protein [Rickettsiaceae bacterium]
MKKLMQPPITEIDSIEDIFPKNEKNRIRNKVKKLIELDTPQNLVRELQNLFLM